MKGKIVPESKMNMADLINSVFNEDLYIYYVYSVLKSKGFIVKREEWYKISRAIRLSTSVRKKTLVAGFIDGELKYIDIERLRDI